MAQRKESRREKLKGPAGEAIYIVQPLRAPLRKPGEDLGLVIMDSDYLFILFI